MFVASKVLFSSKVRLAAVWNADTNLVRQAKGKFLLHSLHVDAVVGTLRAGQRRDDRRQVQSDCLKGKDVVDYNKDLKNEVFVLLLCKLDLVTHRQSIGIAWWLSGSPQSA